MPKIDKRYDPINRKDKPSLDATKSQEMAKLKRKLEEAEAKLTIINKPRNIDVCKKL